MKLRQAVRFHEFKPLPDILRLSSPRLLDSSEAHRQLAYVEKYAADLGCRCVVVEDHYVDRDHMEDHSVFYSKSLTPYPNYCTRLNFFRSAPRDVQKALGEARQANADVEEYRAACLDLSERFYLGFSVIKPLVGCPVGRTVLRTFPRERDSNYRRSFDCTCQYEAHLLGVRLTVRGLAFQQQDLGVSACATTALWSALQRAGDLEQSTVATPAQITTRASQYRLPFGRTMPSEGLSLDQMCEAVRSFGFSPNLFRHETCDNTRALIYSAIRSGVCPVLIVNLGTDLIHAVAAVGMRVRRRHRENLVLEFFDDDAGDMTALYVHDDRIGPYLRALIETRKDEFFLRVPLRADEGEEFWSLSHILIPMHIKIRLSFGELREVAVSAVATVHALREALGFQASKTRWSAWIHRSHSYIESLVFSSVASDGVVKKLCSAVPFPRYVAVVRMEAADLDPIDILVDTTGTQRNLHYLAVVSTQTTREATRTLGENASDLYECPLIGP